MNQTERERQLLSSALWYAREKGFSVIPVKADKRPFIAWEKFQKEKANEEQIRQWWGEEFKGANIGIVTGKISGLTVLDADSADGFAALLPHIAGINTPSAQTPKGRHLYFSCVDGLGNKGRFMTDCDVRSEGGYVLAPPSIISGKKYAWVKGSHIKDTPFALAPPSLISIFALSLYRRDVMPTETPESPPLHAVTSVTNRNIDFNEGSRDETMFHVANYLLKGGMPIGEAEQFLSIIAAKVCNPPFSERDVSIKIQSALKRVRTRERNLASEIEEWLSVTGRFISVTECDRELQIVTSEAKANRRVIFHRLCKRGILEADSTRPGCFRRVEKEFETVDIMNLEDGELFDLILPFGVDKYIDIFPKDLFVYAGVPNAGKTAVMLEALRLNMNVHKCFYFSSEMGRYNCKKRISKHEETKEWKFKFIEDFKSFVDVIQPDDVNFIDYVEVPDGEYYKIPSILSGIQRKLNKGVAIVALQKQPDQKGGHTKWAVGGAQTLAKPAVFITIDPDYPGAVMRIEKAKNFKKENPNGYVTRFKIRDGINLIQEGYWHPEMDEKYKDFGGRS